MEIDARLAELAGELNALEADLVHVVAEAIDTGQWGGDGFRSVAHWLTIQLGCSPARARQLETTARRIGEFPVLAERFRAGVVSHCQVQVVAQHVPGWADAQATKMAPYATVPQLRRIVRAQFPPDIEPDRDWLPQDGESNDDTTASGSADSTDDPTTDASVDGTTNADNDGTANAGDDGSTNAGDDGTTNVGDDGTGGCGCDQAEGAGGDGLLDDRLWYRWSPDGRLVGWFDLAVPTGIVFEAAICEAQDRLFSARGSAVAAGEAFADVIGRAANSAAEGRLERFKHFIHIDTDNITTHNAATGSDSNGAGPNGIRRTSTGAHSNGSNSAGPNHKVGSTRTGDGATVSNDPAIANSKGRGSGRVRCRVSLTNGVNLPASVADYMSCDTSTQPVWVTNRVPVGVGRSQRTVPTRLRRLIVYRDQGCRVPGCAITHIEIHHIRHWSDGGPTETHNLVSLCARHHKEHHSGRLTIHGNPDDGTLWFGDRHGRPLRTGPRPKPPDERKTRTKRGAFVHPTGEKFQIRYMGQWQRPKVPKHHPAAQ